MCPNRSIDQRCLSERTEEYSCHCDGHGALTDLPRHAVHGLSPLQTHADITMVNLDRRF
jgi:hypothetical protein